MIPTDAFSAAQVARILGRSPRAIRRSLEPVAPVRVDRVAGNETRFYSLASLPDELRAEILGLRDRLGYRAAADLVAAADRPWEPEIPWDEISEKGRAKAADLRGILQPLLEGDEAQRRSRAVTARLLSQAFPGAMGYEVGERQALRLIERTIGRDRGRGEFHRLALYLDDADIKRQAPAPAAVATRRPGPIGATASPSLSNAILGLANAADPTLEDRAHLMDGAFRDFEAAVAGIEDAIAVKRAKRAIMQKLLDAVPGMTRPPGSVEAMRKRFDRDYSGWCAGGRCVDALKDGRRGASGRGRPSVPEDEIESLLNYAVRKRCIGTAWQFAMAESEGAPRLPMLRAFCGSLRYPPRWVRDKIEGKFRAAVLVEQGARKGALRVASILRRGWAEDVTPGDRFSMDDKTADTYVVDDSPGEDGRLRVFRPQLLFISDEASLYLLGCEVIPSEHYTAAGIRLALLGLNDEERLGLPRDALVLENGTFKSRQILGSGRPGQNAVSWRVTEAGLRTPEIGIRIHYCTPSLPRAKRIESGFARLHPWWVDLPGYCGTDERVNMPERTRVARKRLDDGALPEEAGLLTLSQFKVALVRIMTEFNRRACHGPDHAGRAPADLWDASILRHPLKKLPENARHLLASDHQERTVRGGGFTVPIGNVDWPYADPGLVAWEGKKVEVRFNYQRPELASVFDMRGNFILTARSLVCDARASRTPEGRVKLSTARRIQAGIVRESEAIRRAAWRDAEFVVPRHRVASTIMNEAAHPERSMEEAGKAREDLERHSAADEAEAREHQRLDRKASRLGIAVGDGLPKDRQRAGLSLLERAQRRMAAAPEAQSSADEGTANA